MYTVFLDCILCSIVAEEYFTTVYSARGSDFRDTYTIRYTSQTHLSRFKIKLKKKIFICVDEKCTRERERETYREKLIFS